MAARMEVEISATDKASAAINYVAEKVQGLASGVGSALAGIGRNWMNISQFIRDTGNVIQGFGNMVVGAFRPFIDAGAQMEGFNLQLRVLLGSSEKAASALGYLRKKAEELPQTLPEIIAGATQIKAYGMSIEKWMVPAADLSKRMGVSMAEAVGQIGRAFSSGAASADLFQQRGILNVIAGYGKLGSAQDLYAMKLEDFRDLMYRAFTDPSTGIAGMATGMAKTWPGLLSMIEDKFLGFKAAVADYIFPAVKAAAEAVVLKLDQWAKDGTLQEWAKKTGVFLLEMWNGVLDAAPAVVRAIGSVGVALTDVAVFMISVKDVSLRAWEGMRYAVELYRHYLTSGISETSKALHDAKMWIIAEDSGRQTAYFGKLASTIESKTRAVAKAAEELAKQLKVNVKLVAESVDLGKKAPVAPFSDIADEKKPGSPVDTKTTIATLGKLDAAWTSYLKGLESKHKAALDAMMAKEKELANLQSEIAKQRAGYSNDRTDLLRSLLTDEEKYRAKKSDIAAFEKAADRATGENAISIYKELQAKRKELIEDEKRFGFQSKDTKWVNETAVREAVEVMDRYQKKIEEIQDTQITDKAGEWATAAASVDVFAASVAAAKQRVADVNAEIAAVTAELANAKTLSLETEAAKAKANELRSVVDALFPPGGLHRTVIIEYKTKASPIRPFSEGMADIKARMLDLPKSSDFTVMVGLGEGRRQRSHSDTPNSAGLVQAEDGSWVPLSFYGLGEGQRQRSSGGGGATISPVFNTTINGESTPAAKEFDAQLAELYKSNRSKLRQEIERKTA